MTHLEQRRRVCWRRSRHVTFDGHWPRQACRQHSPITALERQGSSSSPTGRGRRGPPAKTQADAQQRARSPQRRGRLARSARQAPSRAAGPRPSGAAPHAAPPPAATPTHPTRRGARSKRPRRNGYSHDANDDNRTYSVAVRQDAEEPQLNRIVPTCPLVSPTLVRLGWDPSLASGC